MQRSGDPKQFLRLDETARIEAAIANAEQNTSAEIKLVLCRHCWGNIRDKAVKVFRKLGLDRTSEHNCLLILLVTTTREFAIYADSGINAKVEPDYWSTEKDRMQQAFREDKFGDGIAAAVISVGQRLSKLFPPTAVHRRQVSNEVAHVE